MICGGANLGRAGRQLEGDDIDGGPGSDYIDSGQDRRPVGSEGYADILRYSKPGGGVHVDLSSSLGTVVDGPDTDTIRVAEGLWVLGSQYADVIIGSRFDDDLEGNRGADVLQGGRGDDGLDEYEQLVVDAAAGNVRSSITTFAPLPVTGVERWRPTAEQTVVFLGGPGPDWVDGTDRIDGRLGQDTCVGGEQVRRCELT